MFWEFTLEVLLPPEFVAKLTGKPPNGFAKVFLLLPFFVGEHATDECLDNNE